MSDKTIGSKSSQQKSSSLLGSSSAGAISYNGSSLKRLNYFDGKFLRAPDLITEQQALLNQVRISNQAGGYGIVHGYDCTLGNDDTITLGGGLAIDAAGKVLLLNDNIDIDINELIDSASTLQAVDVASAAKMQQTESDKFVDCEVKVEQETASPVATESTDIYLITLHHVEAYCGEEDVYGKLCSEACSTSTNKSYIIEGIEVRATALNLSVLLKQSSAVSLTQKHLRSRIAAAYYEEERLGITPHISAEGLRSSIWCLGAEALSRNGIPVAVLGRSNTTTLFLDAWISRRERMESPPRHYWAARMMFRPWNIFLAQVLQFQCQLRHCLSHQGAKVEGEISETDPCAETHKAAAKAAEGMRYLLDQMGKMSAKLAEFDQGHLMQQAMESGMKAEQAQEKISQEQSPWIKDLSQLEKDYQKLVDTTKLAVPDQLLINCGIVEVPSAGYLPVNLSETVTVNEQITRQFGAGVDLRFCVVRPDYVAHAMEEVQHMERICLLSGLDDPANIQEVDVLVPNGEILDQQQQQSGGYQAQVGINTRALKLGWPLKEMHHALESHDAAEVPAEYYAESGEGAEGIESAGANHKTLNTNHDALMASQQLKKDLLKFPNMSGAARGEASDGGGYAFYCAAQSGHSLSSGDWHQGQVMAAMAASQPQSVLNLMHGGSDAYITEEAAAAVAAKNEKLSSGHRINTNHEALAALATPVSSFWIDLKTDQDPFTMATGDITDVRAKIIVMLASSRDGVEGAIIEERHIMGQLGIQQSAVESGGSKLSARLIGDGTWKRSRVGVAGEQQTEQLKLDEELRIATIAVAGLPPTVQVVMNNPTFLGGLDNVKLIAERSWISATQSRMRVIVRYQQDAAYHEDGAYGSDAWMKVYEQYAGSQDIVLAETVLTETSGDDSVLIPGNAYHGMSISALNDIGRLTQHSGFADQSGKLLFPPVQDISSKLEILAKEPWVLFHRRRAKTCHQKVEKPPEQPQLKSRHYRVYHIDLPAEVEVDKVSKQLVDDIAKAIAEFQINPVTTVAYEQSLASVTSSHTAVRSDWQNSVLVSSDVHIGIIASEGDVINEGPALAASRLQSLTNVLGPVTETADTLKLLNVNTVPAALSSSENDGVIIYFTKAVATICHRVFGVKMWRYDRFLKNVEKYLKSGKSIDQVAEDVPYVQELGEHAAFLEGSEQFYGANQAQKLLNSWELSIDRPINGSLSLGANESNPEKAISKKQGLEIAKAIGFDVSQHNYYRGATENIFTGCPKATFLLTKFICHDIYIYRPPVRDDMTLDANFLNEIAQKIRDEGITPDTLDSAKDGSRFMRLGSVDFYEGTDSFDEGSSEALVEAWNTLSAGKFTDDMMGYFISVARSGDTADATTENLSLTQVQGVGIANAMAITTGAMLAETNNPEVDFPVDCDALTLLVIPEVTRKPGGDHDTDTSLEVADPTEDSNPDPATGIDNDDGPGAVDTSTDATAELDPDGSMTHDITPDAHIDAEPADEFKPGDDGVTDPAPDDFTDATAEHIPGDSVTNDIHPDGHVDAAPADPTPDADGIPEDDKPDVEDSMISENGFPFAHVDFGEAVNFDENNEVIVHAGLTKELEKLKADGKAINHLEIIGMAAEVDEAAAEMQAENLLILLKAEGVAAEGAGVVFREATDVEKLKMEESNIAMEKIILLGQ